ncbi:Hint domain-containing protein [Rhodobacter capsulatus]|nr:Hint domain-containing protein [Rhodobacter capsulatus]
MDGGIDEDTIFGGTGNDSLIGGAGADQISGGDDRDTFVVASAAAGAGDVIDGNEGGDDYDTLDLTGAGRTNILYDPNNPENGTVQFLDDHGNVVGTLSFSNIEKIICDRDGIVTGTAGADLIDYDYTGDPDGDRIDHNDAIIPGDGSQDDRVVAGAGNDTIRSGLGNDTVDAGTGDDLVEAGLGNDSVLGGDGKDTIFGGDGNDTLLGDAGDDLLDGGNSSDSLDGGAGHDTLLGGEGNDTLIGGEGNDSLDGGNSSDSLAGGAGNDTLLGGEGNDTLIGGEGNDSLDGGAASDTLDGGAGDDTLIGGEGDDSILGGEGNDLAAGGTGQDTIRGGAGDDTITGDDGDDRLYGDAGNDSLSGGQGQDLLDGGAGNDTLTGGDGVDTLLGGDDRDVFIVVNRDGGNHDVIDGNEGGDDFDTLDLTTAGPLRINYDPTNPENGTVSFLDDHGNVTGSLTFRNIEKVIPPCFTPGTLIATPKGERLVEELREGDKILTRDNGIQEIRWIGRTDLTRAQLMATPHLKPVLIRAGSLGNGLPERDMLVSPNHRMLVANERTALYFEEHEVLVAAKHLVDNRGVKPVETLGTSYIHFMFDRHEVVLGNGAWTESFQPGDQSLEGLGNAQRAEILELFPELRCRDGLEGYGAARKILKKHEAALLRHR